MGIMEVSRRAAQRVYLAVAVSGRSGLADAKAGPYFTSSDVATEKRL
jgi:hypothetical protein